MTDDTINANQSRRYIKCPRCEHAALPVEEIMQTLNNINSRIDDLYALIKHTTQATQKTGLNNPIIADSIKTPKKRKPNITSYINNINLISWINNKYDMPHITFIKWTEIITGKINANHLTLIFNKGFVRGMIKTFQEIIPNDISYKTANNGDYTENGPLPICAFTETKKIYGVLGDKWDVIDNSVVVNFIYAIDTAIMKQFYIWKRSNTLTNSEGTMSNVYIKNLNKIMVSRSENMELLQNGLYLHICRKLPANVDI